MSKLKQRREAERLRKLKERFYHDAREQIVCSCGRRAVGVTGKPADYYPPFRTLLVCDYHNYDVTKAKYHLPPWPEFDPAKPVFNLDEWLSQVPFYNFEKKV